MIKIIIKFFCFLAIIAIIAVAGWNINVSSRTDGLLSDVMFANVEALAGEDGDCTKIYTCRKVNCNATMSITADATGCVNVPVIGKLCGYTVGTTVTISGLPGEKENATGGNEWCDSDACQAECVVKI